ncbi:GNAT family N-acetyltransferase [Lewinella sp. 4G2]|uniref:GNAT family N-acetyltransferase n=1 Tax=Lewinella sp. 4G2 TaxID=1803372 RepID=UPI0007B4C391|nr:GNAT family N-acetyltransferase [Lewinella sp. 4G2]OAV43344.1 hypothetical protein A3850_002020 [Lewinella sp. 4G2]
MTPFERQNLDNLRDLWAQAGAAIGRVIKHDNFSIAVGGEPNGWPNRVWLHEPLTPEVLAQARSTVDGATKLKLFLPRATDRATYAALHPHKGAYLTGMHLSLSDQPFAPSNIILKRVTTEADARGWATDFEAAFNYHIPPSLLLKMEANTQYFRAEVSGDYVGTACLHYTENGRVAGIHSIGTLPEFRRKGYARQIMQSLLTTTQQKGAELAVLQASAKGLGLYQQLGFIGEFDTATYDLT